MQPPPPPPVLVAPTRRSSAIFLKLSGIGLLILLLQIPLFLTDGVLVERRDYQRQATAEIAGICSSGHSLEAGPGMGITVHEVIGRYWQRGS